jgi:hypothetical protein
MKENADAGIAEMKAGFESYHLTGSLLMMPQWQLMFAEAQLRAGRPGEALAALSRGMAHVSEFQEHVHEPELHRLRGEILIAQGAASAGEASLLRAIEIAQGQQARILELRAALALARHRRAQGRNAEAITLLQPLDEQLQEGRDLPELRETRELLESLGCAAQSAGA